MKNILIEHTRASKMVHFMVKKFVPVFEKVVSKETWLSNHIGELRYTRWSSNFDQPTPTSIPHKLWPIVRIRRKRAGQLELFPVLKS